MDAGFFVNAMVRVADWVQTPGIDWNILCEPVAETATEPNTAPPADVMVPVADAAEKVEPSASVNWPPAPVMVSVQL